MISQNPIPELDTGRVILQDGAFVLIEVDGAIGLTVFESFSDVRFAPHESVCGALHQTGPQSLHSERDQSPIEGLVSIVEGDLRTVLRFLSDNRNKD